MSKAPEQKIDLTTGFGRAIVHRGTAEKSNVSAKEAFAAALKTGDVIKNGPNEGWVYLATAGLEPFLVAPYGEGAMNWWDARTLAMKNGMHLPTKHQLEVIWAMQSIPPLSQHLNLTGLEPDGWYWSSSQRDTISVWCKRLSDGRRHAISKRLNASLHCVRPYTPA